MEFKSRYSFHCSRLNPHMHCTVLALGGKEERGRIVEAVLFFPVYYAITLLAAIVASPIQ
jgi:hypothetical protein